MPCPHNEISIVQRSNQMCIRDRLGADRFPGVLIKVSLYHPGFGEMCIRDRLFFCPKSERRDTKCPVHTMKFPSSNVATRCV